MVYFNKKVMHDPNLLLEVQEGRGLPAEPKKSILRGEGVSLAEVF
jgi:hypothetical protein